MTLTPQIHRVLRVLLLAFMLMVLAVGYWGLVEAPRLAAREDNPRRVLAEQRVVRGSIYDRNGTLLVTSQPDAAGLQARVNFHPATYSALGYFSYRYGAGGLELAYDDVLRGANTTPTLGDLLLSRPTVGTDLQVTLDLNVQRTVQEAMLGYTGAAVVLAVPSGDVLALVSLPTYDPNTLNADWATLSTDAGEPFFNRVVQGAYQPGAMLQTAIIAAALERGQPLEAVFGTGTDVVTVGDVEIGCVTEPEAPELTLAQAYHYGCPQPFTQIAGVLGPDVLQATFDTLRVQSPLRLPGYTADPAPRPVALVAGNSLTAEAVGQGEVRLSPLNAALITAASINDGNAPRPTLLRATRPPGAADWQPQPPPINTLAYTTAPNARVIADLMRASTDGTARFAASPGLDIGGHGALAYAGNTTVAWFSGFVTLAGGEGAVVAVALENSEDVGAAADVGRIALVAAHAALQVP